MALFVVFTGGIALGAWGGWSAAENHYRERIKVLETALDRNVSTHTQPKPGGPRINGRLLVGWGTSAPGCSMTLNGSALMDFAGDFDAAIACGLTDSSIDKYQDHRISISSGYTIAQGEIRIQMPWSDRMRRFREQIEDAVRRQAKRQAIPEQETRVQWQTWHMVLLFPKGKDLSTTAETLNDVDRLGGRVFGIEEITQ
jgi:hypothetical protein